jgi:exonuclease III
MRIVSWNCCWQTGGFTEVKFKKISQEVPEKGILVIQECTESEVCRYKKNHGFNYAEWHGDGKDSSLGIGVFSREYKFSPVEKQKHDTKFRYVIPYQFVSPGSGFLLFAVWTKRHIENDDFHNLDYVKNLHEAFKDENFGKLLKRDKPSLVIGDFNTFANKKNSYLEDQAKGLPAILKNCAKGEEAVKKTYYHRDKNPEKGGFGIDDFCFATSNIADHVHVKIYQKSEDEWTGEGKKLWHGLSDHCPIIVDFDI